MKKSKGVILCIDDDQDFLDSVRIIVEGAGYTVESAGSAEEGLRLYRKSRPDMVLVDLMMEEVDAGTTFVKEAKALGATPPIFMLSSAGDSLNLNTDYAKLGLTGVLQKPVNAQALLGVLKARLG